MLRIYLALLLLPQWAFSAHYCSGTQYKLPKKYVKILAHKELILNRISMNKHLALKSDETLSLFVKAKSTVFMSWLKRNQLDPARDDEKIVKKWRRYYLETVLLRKYPLNNPHSNKVIEKGYDEIVSKSFPDKTQKRYEDIFSKVKKASRSYLKEKVKDANARKQILKKIKLTKLYFSPNLKVSKFKKNMHDFLNWSLSYDPVNNEINVGLDSLKIQSDENLFAILAHELAHAFDPCRWNAFYQGPYPFEEVINCLRGKDSASLKARDDSDLKRLIDEGSISKEVGLSLKQNPTCNRPFFPPPGKQKDQSLEGFADWYSADLLGFDQAFLGPKVRKEFCKNSNLSKGSSYLSNRDRLEKIYLAHPVLKRRFKVKSNVKYCKI